MGSEQQACAHDIVEIEDDQVLCCPPEGKAMWNAHPRIYLRIPEQQDRVRCYYCGTLYVKKVTE